MKGKILIVEDEILSAKDLKYKLEDLDYQVIDIVDNGDDAIYEAVEYRPDLVLMDINIKGDIDGISASKKILALDLPVIFLTANINDELFSRANINPSYGFINKPYNIKSLERSIRIAIKRSHIESEKNDLARGIVEEQETVNEEKYLDTTSISSMAKKEYEEGIKYKKRDPDIIPNFEDPSLLKDASVNEAYKILIVEDEMITALDLKGYLESLNYNVVGIVDNTKDALTYAKKYLPHLVLLDINLKGERGIKIAEEMQLLNIAVVFLTAQTDDLTVDDAINTSPYAYITKPFNKKDLEHTVALSISKSLNNIGKIYKVENKVEEKNTEMKIEKTNVLIIFGGSLVLIIVGLLSKNVTWLQWLLFIPAAIMIFLAVFSLLKQPKVKEYDINPYVTIIVPAHNEEYTIRGCVDSLANIDYTLNGKKNYELIIINDGSEDNTAQVLRELKEKHDFIKIITRVPPRSGKGKGFVLNDGLEIGKGEVVAVFDADTQVEPDFLNIIIPYLNEKKVDGVQCRVKMYNKDENFLTRMQHVEFAGFGNTVRAKDILGKAGFLGGNG